MRPGWYNLFMFIGTVAAWVAWVLVATQYYPDSGGWAAMAYFFVSLFCALVGTVYVFSYALQARVIGRLTKPQSVRSCTRQALLLSSLLTLSLLLQGWRLLTWFNMLLVIALFTFIELLFLSREHRLNHRTA